MKTTESIFDRYEEIKPRLPEFKFSQKDTLKPCWLNNLGDLDDQFDMFLFDAFGVLNVGETVIDGAPERIKYLQAKDKLVYILTNAASYQKPALMRKFSKLGFNFGEKNIVSSREILIEHLNDQTKISRDDISQWGVISTGGLEDLPRDLDYAIYNVGAQHANTEFWQADAYIFLSTSQWTEADQLQFLTHLKKYPKPIFVGNPDVVAPRETGITLEPGYFAHEIIDKTNCTVEFFGKPFGNAFSAAIKHAKNTKPDLSLPRCLMVGDTLHTDILGGAAAGMKTALITNYGTYAGQDISPYVIKSEILPNFILPTI